MTSAFDAAEADFSRMNGLRNLDVTDALHKAFIKVDEEGTEAAAATVIVVVGETNVPPQCVAYSSKLDGTIGIVPHQI